MSQQCACFDAAAAQQQAAARWTAEPVALELSTKTDRLNQHLGRDETLVGLSIPLWLWGERSRTVAVADAQVRAAASRVRAAQLRTAAQVREAYWGWQRAHATTASPVICWAHPTVGTGCGQSVQRATWRVPTSTRPMGPWQVRKSG
ncbi:MAG: TolC family protein [Burkholderiales bacterium]|nr:TolC family protein [Burkholderiales bacterium]